MFENRLGRITKKQSRSFNIFEKVIQRLKRSNTELEKLLADIEEERHILKTQEQDAFKLLKQNEKVINNINNIIGNDSDED